MLGLDFVRVLGFGVGIGLELGLGLGLRLRFVSVQCTTTDSGTLRWFGCAEPA